MGVALACLRQLAFGSSHCQAGDGHWLARVRLSSVLEVEESPPRGTSECDEGRARVDPRTLHGESALGCSEVQKLGISLSQSTVAKYMGRLRPSHSQGWRIFLASHAHQIMAGDFFVVPTLPFRLVFVLVILAHDRRQIMHVAVTKHPTVAWTAQQLRNAFPEDDAPRYLLHDRDGAFAAVPTTLIGMHAEAIRTAPHSRQNAYVERVIGSMRRECLDHVIRRERGGLRRCSRAMSHTTCAPARISRLRRTARCPGPSKRDRPDASWRLRKSAACITATIASPRNESVRGPV